MMIDEAMNGLRSVIDSATQRTADAIGNSRSYMERAKLRAKLNEAYRMLGMAEYEASINGVSSMEQINGLIGRITDLRAAMAEINRGIQRGGRPQILPQRQFFLFCRLSGLGAHASFPSFAS